MREKKLFLFKFYDILFFELPEKSPYASLKTFCEIQDFFAKFACFH